MSFKNHVFGVPTAGERKKGLGVWFMIFNIICFLIIVFCVCYGYVLIEQIKDEEEIKELEK